MPPLLDANIWFSLRHPESQRIIQSLLELARQNGGKLPKTGDGRSNGSIRIYAGVNSEGIARVAILHIVSSNVSFSVVQASAMSAGASCVAGGCFRLGGDQFIDPKRLTWSSAWIIADKVRNGHGSQPMESWLTVDQGWARWAQIQAKYSLYIELAEIPLPPSPF
ncbi:hypothetical protein HY008_01805 [Candidatus Woesebacteria bacterium]|nr:hypothetical protein [Candidatus Woesebacteria bacterium]